jgi:hypothetical protein
VETEREEVEPLLLLLLRMDGAMQQDETVT